MAESKLAFYRLEFATDLTSARAPTITLGYMVESAFDGGARFLGLVSRKALTADELSRVNLKTWPQLEELDLYMEGLFQRAWDHVCGADAQDCRLGSEFVAREHPLYSALAFEPLGSNELGVRVSGPIDQIHSRLYAKLHELGRRLKPAAPPEPEVAAPASATTRVKDEVLELA